jgi:uncharacterized protein (TIGR04255 family)
MSAPDATARPSDLPDFGNPPVVEVALSVQFERLPLQTKHVALLWEECRDSFPEWQDHPPLAPAFELFGQGFLNARVGGAALPRAIFKNPEGTQLKQYQADRFVRNWTKAPQAPDYPRYESIRESFATDLAEFIPFIERHALGNFAPNQCEVTYVNLIPLGTGTPNSIADVISPCSGAFSDSFLGKPEATEVSSHFLMTQHDARLVGRLHVQAVVVAYRGTESEAVQLTLTARGQPLGAGVDGVIAFLNLGREYIVKGFTSFTTPQMHETWGKLDGSK